MFIDDYIERISLKEEVKNLKSMNETLASENLELKDQNDMLKNTLIYQNQEISTLKKEAVGWKLCLDKDGNEDKIKVLEARIEVLENDRSEDVETINKLNIRARDLNGTISTLLERVSKSDEENQDLKKRVQQLKDIINDLNKKLYE